MDTYHDELQAALRGMYITGHPDVDRVERLAQELGEPKPHEVELHNDLEYNIDLLERYRRGDVKTLRQSDAAAILNLLRNYYRERYGNPITDKERRA